MDQIFHGFRQLCMTATATAVVPQETHWYNGTKAMTDLGTHLQKLLANQKIDLCSDRQVIVTQASTQVSIDINMPRIQ